MATPIGNLEDITLRAIRILKESDFVACEDTRVARKLLIHYNIKTPMVSYFQHSKLARTAEIINRIRAGKNASLITDAGTPGISDPGNKLVEEAIKNEIRVVPIPGSSAISALISVAGIDLQQFIFLGFPPHKKGRETYFKKVAAADLPVIYYESPHRVIKNLELLGGLAPEKQVILGRELTKMFEETVRGNCQEVLKYFQENKDKVKGEFVIVVH